MSLQPVGRTLPFVVHHLVEVNSTHLHYVAAGEAGSPVLLVHGFPESWWAFNRLIPLLAGRHRVFAVDLRGFGDSGSAGVHDTSDTLAEDLHALVARLDLGPVHLLAQDISGAVAFRLAANHPGDLLSLTGVEMGLAGYGLEALADVARSGAWYIGALATPNAAEAFFSGRERTLIGEFIVPSAAAARDVVTPSDVAELARGYERPGGWGGAAALYGSMLREGSELQALAGARPLALPALAVDRVGSDFTLRTIGAVHVGGVRHAEMAGAGHYVAMEAPAALADALLPFLASVDGPP